MHHLQKIPLGYLQRIEEQEAEPLHELMPKAQREMKLKAPYELVCLQQ